MSAEHSFVASFSIDAERHADFARLSGDYNPIHVDRDAGQRSAFGANVVHGVNTLLSALDVALGAGLLPAKLYSRVQAQFLKPVFVDEAIDLVRVSRDDKRTRFVVRAGDTDLLKITLTSGSAEEAPLEPGEPLAGAERLAPPVRAARERSIEEGGNLSGALPLAVDAAVMRARYPHVVAWLGESRTAGIALLSTIVGMEWPGVHSLFTEARLLLAAVSEHSPRQVAFHVATADPDKFVTTSVAEAPGLRAELTAFFRPAPVPPVPACVFRERVTGFPFKGITAVVVGGSRGLGAVAAQLMAAGGADIVLTYRTSSAEAEQVAGAIKELGANCKVMQFTAGDGLPLSADAIASQPVMLLYFASPHIFRRRTQRYSRPWLNEFLDVYVDAFVDTVSGLCKLTQARIGVLYPSTEALDKPVDQIIEYAAAKAAGEAVCRTLAASNRQLAIVTPRLPRMLTDQTNSIIRVASEDPLEVMQPLLLSLRDAILPAKGRSDGAKP